MDIGGREKLVVVANYKGEDEIKPLEQRHNILIFDRSHSMSYDLDKLISNMKNVIRDIPENDYISILWFAGEGKYKTLVKGAKKDDKITELLDSVNYTVGTTCFSEVLKEAKDIVNELGVICNNFIVNLFTDGEAVVSWGQKEEYRRAKEIVSEMKDNIIALNTIGYGNYYNQDFLVDLANLTDYGVMCHSRDIEDYYKIITEDIERISSLNVAKLDVVSEGNEILYISNKFNKLVDNEIRLKLLDEKKNQIVIIGDDEFEFEINGNVYQSKDIKSKITARTLNPLYYAYAYQKYYLGDRELCLDILAKNVRDKYLVDEQFKAFTYDECMDFMIKLKKAVGHTAYRHKNGECDDNYLPEKDATCVMDLFKLLIEGDSYYIYSKDYKRIGLKEIDRIDKFKPKEGVVVTPISELVFNSKRLNVSIQSVIPGTVGLSDMDSKILGLDNIVESRIYRNQTIVKDGNLNLSTIKVAVSKETYLNLSRLGVKGLMKPVARTAVKGYKTVQLDLSKLPIINRLYLEDIGELDNVLDSAVLNNELAVKQKVINHIKKGIKSDKFNSVQLATLKSNGLTSTLDYIGDMEKAEKVDEDFYEAREIEFGIKGCSSIPAVDDVVRKAKARQKLNENGSIMWSYIKELEKGFNNKIKKNNVKVGSKASLALSKKLQQEDAKSIDIIECDINEIEGLKEYLNEELHKIKIKRLVCSIEQSSVKLAKVLTGSWFKGLIEDGKGGYSYSRDGHTLVIKTKRTKVYF